MAILPNVDGARPAPRYGQPFKTAAVVEVDKGAGLSALGDKLSGLSDILVDIQDKADRSDAKDRANKLKAFALKDKHDRWGLTLGESIKESFMPDNNTILRDEISR